jgi:type 1 fimbria pilin
MSALNTKTMDADQFAMRGCAVALRGSLLYLLVGLFMSLASLCAHANSTCNDSNGNNVLAAGTITVPVNAAVGATVATQTPLNFIVQCRFLSGGLNDTSTNLYAKLSTTAALAAGFNDVYQTSIPGLGVRYTFNSPAGQCNVANVTMQNGTITLTCPFSGPLNGPYIQYSVMVTASFVATGQIAPGASTLSSAPLISVSYTTDEGGPWGQTPVYTGSASGVLTHATCSVNQTNVSVIMPTADTRAFSSGVGAVAAPQPFSLSLSCATGATVLITLTDSVNPANRGTALQLAANSTAKGIGVQVLNSAGTPVAFGPDSATPGNTNQWTIGASPNGTLQVPLTARYVRTGNVSAGSVKALATFTMSYQ